MNSAQSMLYMSAAMWPHIWGLVEMHLHRPSPYLPALKQGLARVGASAATRAGTDLCMSTGCRDLCL